MSSFLRSSLNAWKLRGKQNIAAWAVAGTLAYYLWIKPEKDAEMARRLDRELARNSTKPTPYKVSDRIAPMADPQDTGLVKGSRRN